MSSESLKIFAETETCPARNVLDRFGDKWSTLVILVLNEEEKLRFNEIHKVIGDISQKMLTVTLRSLEADGLVSRKVYPEIPPRVEYKLTDLGKSLVPHISSLIKWADQNFSSIMASRSKYNQKAN
ncbi:MULTISPECIES: winged helix-turn-helix transcriptional regulator [Mesonia]|uniref:HTH-type transcriptional regulator YybR n=1 Tax=Mesonia oceanica TaxID=2687242 RepID=A0AC61YBF4_9FLAO|nr:MULTISPECIES: helix-turn-helix domain-containing protein [Mesonia]MBJ96972.1 transcriptional regulator [Flavobacteriaceae bacterium]MAN25918.1 transcriptional regulator [Mesonia sp.]MAN26161.1 transcriptional regulator [Mesonia sp.]MAQ39529.1 transcriptional regulator [Mesonia sp.]VVV01585.1 putative HTH-type transcriptional regulator YybR [Mesonia oceanica]|tara:strand:+ start:20125 stop:20502 length:378 start_codon:yes stop_codon:yes gene_type:complete